MNQEHSMSLHNAVHFQPQRFENSYNRLYQQCSLLHWFLQANKIILPQQRTLHTPMERVGLK